MMQFLKTFTATNIGSVLCIVEIGSEIRYMQLA